MPMIERSETLQLGDAATDTNHVEFCALLNVVIDTSDVEFIGVLNAFIDHTEHHFAEENAWMDAADFPPRHCHRGEHDDVLVLCREVRKHAAAGEMKLGRRLVAELLVWFAQHVDMMDRMMTTYLAQMGNAMRTVKHVG